MQVPGKESFLHVKLLSSFNIREEYVIHVTGCTKEEQPFSYASTYRSSTNVHTMIVSHSNQLSRGRLIV
ncbi:hypothetical protein D0463_09750 [Bacillus sp. V59.32b]|nr:hypothetical protein D0463_09750 [Bacillus sp. V59.32b]